jgi:ParB/RepB/Spo0J family partition protein
MSSGTGKPGVQRLPGPKNRTDNTVRSLLSAKDLEIARNPDAFNIPLNKLVPNPNQPRQKYNDDQDQELAESIREQGILQPLIVRKIEGGKYQIVAGERRYRAAKEIGLTEVPVVLKEYNEEQARIVGLLENLQRVDLDPQDEQRYYLELQNSYNWSLNDIAKRVNKSIGYVRNRLDGKLESLKQTHENEKQDSEIDNNNASQARKLENSQPKNGAEKTGLKFSSSPFIRFSHTLDKTLQVLEQEALDNTTAEALQSSIEEMEQKLTLIKQKLKKISR